LEVRSPMLDYTFVEFAWSIPPRLRIQRGAGKYLLRRALENKLDPQLAWRRKAGFDVPLNEWFRSSLRWRFEDELRNGRPAIHQWIRPDAVAHLWSDHLGGGLACGPTLWKLVMLEAWAGADYPPTRAATMPRRALTPVARRRVEPRVRV